MERWDLFLRSLDNRMVACKQKHTDRSWPVIYRIGIGCSFCCIASVLLYLGDWLLLLITFVAWFFNYYSTTRILFWTFYANVVVSHSSFRMCLGTRALVTNAPSSGWKKNILWRKRLSEKWEARVIVVVITIRLRSRLLEYLVRQSNTFATTHTDVKELPRTVLQTISSFPPGIWK